MSLAERAAAAKYDCDMNKHETEKHLKNAVFCDGTMYGSYKKRRFGETYHPHHQGGNNQRAKINVSSKL
jgi:hypothetical protein